MHALHHLKLFGVPNLLDASGTVVRFRTRKHLALLVYLTLEARRRPVFRDALVDLLWPDALPGRSRHSLSQALSAIRKRLGRESVTRSAQTVRLVADLTTDLEPAARQHVPADDLSHPLAGLGGCAGAAFAHWVDGVRARCVREVSQSLLRELNDARAGGHAKRVHERAAMLYQVDRLCSTAVMVLAEQRLLEGDVAAARRVLLDYKRDVAEEFAGRPAPEVERLLSRVDRGLVGGRPEAQPSRDNDGRPDVFVGRDRELAELEALWTGASGGGLRTCLMTGPAGIGKSALLRRFCTSISMRAAPVFSIGCEEIGESIPFAAISDLIGRLARDPSFGSNDPLWLAEASRVTPGLHAMYPGIPSAQPAAAEAVRLRVAEAIAHIVETVAEGGPLLLSVDDVQHIDAASRDVLYLLCRRLASTPTFLLATLRSNGSDDSPVDHTATVGGLRWQERMVLHPLSPHHTKQLIGRLCGAGTVSESVSAHIVHLSQGNPYLAELLLSDWQLNPDGSLVQREAGASPDSTWRPPATMRMAFARQHENLSVKARRTLHVLAVASRALTTDEVATLLAVHPSAIHQAMLELLDRGIVRVERGAVGFKNQLHRAFVYHSLSEEAQRYHHSRLAQSLDVLKHEGDFQAALEAAHHFLKAGMTEEGADAACRGADTAIARGAPREAEAALALAISHRAERPRLQLLLAAALGAQSRYRESLDALARWRPLTRLPHDDAFAMLVRAEAVHRGRLADDVTIKRSTEQALALAETCGDETLVMGALQMCAEVASDLGSPASIATVGQKAVSIAAGSNRRDTRAKALLTQGFCHLMVGELQPAIARFEESRGVLEELSLDMELRQAMNGLGLAYCAVGEFREAIESFRRALSIADRIGDSASAASMCSNIGTIYADLGAFDKAGDWLHRALELEAVATNARRAAQIQLNMVNLQMAIGNLEQARHHMEVAGRHAQESQLWKLEVDVMLFEADYQIACEDFDKAWRLFERIENIVAGRQKAIFSIEKYERLRRYYLWKNEGYSAMACASQETDLRKTCVPIGKQLEVRAFEEWVKQQERIEGSNLAQIRNEILAYQLTGLLAYLEVVGVA